MKKFIKFVFETLLDFCFSNKKQIWIAQYILFRAKGEVNDNPTTNGEFWLQKQIMKHLKGKEGIVFDVGANIGNWSLEWSRKKEIASVMYAFEPSSVTFQTLKELNFAHHSQFLFKSFNLALSDKDGEEHLYISDPLSGTNSIHQRISEGKKLDQSEVQDIQALRGDTFCEEFGITHIDFLKIDTEGHEMAVIMGFEKMLLSKKIDYLQFEYGGTWIDSRHFLFDAFCFFEAKGYKIAKLHSKKLEFFDHYDREQETFAGANYVAVRDALVCEWTQV
jgi:FkbM family methyltransferase